MKRDRWTRRAFVHGSSALPVALVVGGGAAAWTSPDARNVAPAAQAHGTFPRQDPARVRDTVLYAHRDLSRVRELVEASPALARAAWDWGFGDWESALGAASHTGQRAIAEYLIGKGARPTLFSAAMLGQLEVVRAMVKAVSSYAKIEGPHGILLIDHARAGGEQAAGVVEYLAGLSEVVTTSEKGSLQAEQLQVYVGSFRYGHESSEVLEVLVRNGSLAIARGQDPPRPLISLGEHRFHPVGARAVHIVFEVFQGLAQALVVHDAEAEIRALRTLVP